MLQISQMRSFPKVNGPRFRQCSKNKFINTKPPNTFRNPKLHNQYSAVVNSGSNFGRNYSKYIKIILLYFSALLIVRRSFLNFHVKIIHLSPPTSTWIIFISSHDGNWAIRWERNTWSFERVIPLTLLTLIIKMSSTVGVIQMF